METAKAAYGLIAGVGFLEKDKALALYRKAFQAFTHYWLANPSNHAIKTYHFEIYKSYAILLGDLEDNLDLDTAANRIKKLSLEDGLGL